MEEKQENIESAPEETTTSPVEETAPAPEKKDRKKKEKRSLYDFDRKAIKKSAHAVVRSHYVLLLFVCLILMFIGLEYNSSVSIFRSSDESTETSSASSGGLYRGKVTQVITDIVNDRMEEGSDEAKAALRQYRKNSKKDSVLGRRRGAFASIVNTVSSGYIFIQLAQAIRNLSHSDGVTAFLFTLLMFIVYFGIWAFVRQPISAVARRFFLEARVYKKVPMHHGLMFHSVHRWPRVSLAITYAYVLEVLWWFTIIGGVIKRYAYSMVPYIVAENPDIKPREAVKLSRRMMYGHKWEAFKIDMSFIPWYILSMVTFGFSDIFYTIPYKMAVRAEYYTHIRNCAKLDNIEGADRLNDKYLFEKAEEGLIREQYPDVDKMQAYVDSHKVELKSWQQFFIRNFGIWLGSSEEKNEYQKIESMKFQIHKEEDAIAGNAYPRRLHPLYDPSDIESRDLEGTVAAFRCYTVWSLILMFFAFSLVGWLWEVSLHIITDGVFVNRGTMHGPWLPIYGFGAIYILIFLNRFRKNVFVEFIGAVILSGFVEYMTSWYLEITKGMRWWDYTGYFLNLNGRICGEGLLVFGLGGIAVVYVIAPLLDRQISKIKSRQLIAACVILLALYNVDGVYSKIHPNAGKGITDYTEYDDTGKTKAISGLPGGAGIIPDRIPGISLRM